MKAQVQSRRQGLSEEARRRIASILADVGYKVSRSRGSRYTIYLNKLGIPSPYAHAVALLALLLFCNRHKIAYTYERVRETRRARVAVETRKEWRIMQHEAAWMPLVEEAYAMLFHGAGAVGAHRAIALAHLVGEVE